MHIRRLVTADSGRYWNTRNRGLSEFPNAFTTTFEEGLATLPEQLARRFGGLGSDDFMMGAFAENGDMAGHAGFQREPRIKNRHKGSLIGMYVIPEYRSQRVGRSLLGRLIDEVRSIDGVEQLNLTVTHSNDTARTLYLRAGFVPFGLERNALKFEGRYYDKEHMALVL